MLSFILIIRLRSIILETTINLVWSAVVLVCIHMDNEKGSASVICHSVSINPRSIIHSNGSRFLLWVYMFNGWSYTVHFYRADSIFSFCCRWKDYFHVKVDKAAVITLEESGTRLNLLRNAYTVCPALCNILKLLKFKHGNRLVFLWIPSKQDGLCLSNGIILQGVVSLWLQNITSWYNYRNRYDHI